MEYTIIYKNRFIEMYLSNISDRNIDIETAIRAWDSLRKGYNFIIAVGDYTNPMFLSVPFFNDFIGGDKSAL